MFVIYNKILQSRSFKDLNTNITVSIVVVVVIRETGVVLLDACVTFRKMLLEANSVSETLWQEITHGKVVLQSGQDHI